jgi:hypothetical protein
MNESEIEFSWRLADDNDCETCGFTSNEVGLELWDEDEGIWQLYIRVGCYGGDSVMSNSPEWETKSEDIVEQALLYPDFNEELASLLRKHIAAVGVNSELR